MSLRSYSSPFNLGHAGAKALFDGPVVVEEKIDGSQFSFGVDDAGVLHCRSKGAQLHLDAPERMFAKAVKTARMVESELRPGWTYRGEYLQKPKHNALAYDRVPAAHVILFDIDRGDQDYLAPDDKRTEAGRIGLESVPVVYEGVITSAEQFKALLPAQSVLGRVAPEGIVAKNYAEYTPDRKVMMGKYVTESFRETHKGEWRKSNPTNGDVLATLVSMYRTPARWDKAVQHLRDAGTLERSPRDIGALLKEVGQDVHRECSDEIRDKLFAWAWPHIQRGITNGLPQWYKERLLESAFPAEVGA